MATGAQGMGFARHRHANDTKASNSPADPVEDVLLFKQGRSQRTTQGPFWSLKAETHRKAGSNVLCTSCKTCKTVEDSLTSHHCPSSWRSFETRSGDQRQLVAQKIRYHYFGAFTG
jgi:hypothetical protein